MKKLIFLATFALVGCSTVKGDIAGIEATLAAAETSALAYVNLPLCSDTQGSPCASQENLTLISKSAIVAYNSVKAAELSQTADALTQAKADLQALQNIIAQVTK